MSISNCRFNCLAKSGNSKPAQPSSLIAIILSLVFGLLVSTAVYAESGSMLLAQSPASDDPVKTTPQTGSAMQGVEDTLVQWHAILSEKVESLGEAADKLFDSDIVFQEINQTSVRLRLDLDAIEGQDAELEPKLDLKWVLPAAEERWSLLLQSEDDFDSDSSNLGDPLLGDDDRGSAALDYVVTDNEKLRTSFALGLKSDQQYGRFNLRRYFALGANAKTRIRNRLTYFTEDGWENDFRFDIDVPFGKPLPDTREFQIVSAGEGRRPWLFRSASQIRWFDETESTLYEQRFSFFTRTSERSAIAYEAVARGCSNPNTIEGTEQCKGYDVRLRYRWVSKYPWLSVMVMPVADFPEWNDYDLNAQIRLRMEIWFGRGRKANAGPVF